MAIVHFVNYKRGTQSRAAMRGVMCYVMQEKKTAWEGGPLVSGINCQPQSVYDDFLNTKLLYHKDGGVMFYHMVQSFPKGAAVDPRQAHEAARRLAEYFDGCEVLVCTHVDREHIHSHCIINSVNFETGKKLHMAKEQIQELMRRNDAICQEMGLPVFDAPTQQARGMSGAEYHTALKGQSWKLRLMNTIDECMKYAADKDAFVSLMASEGYAVRWESTRKYITYTTPDGLKCRDSKLHEEKYCKEVMEHEFRIRAEFAKRKFHRAEEIDGGIEADESAEQRAAVCAAADAAHCDPVRSAAGDEQIDGAGRRNKLGAGGNSEGPAGAKNARRPDTGAAVSGGDAEIADGDEQAAGTGWEPEREIFLQVDRLAPGLQPAGGPQVDHAGADPWHGGTGGLVWRGSDPQPVPLIPAAAGLAAAGTLLDEDEDAEEKRRRMEAKIAAENFGAVVGLAAGTALAVKEKLDEQTAQEEQKKQQHEQTMGGF
ncbi:relaxase/mobilization nuclease domain-containing protein [uncultured Oscillibacter sp.]|uniref:relaxase/mobilization nuclease domain-containing protein n=1 Tax=uncultured Oscillibacter sp. TaxID=876091 RepID=UPI0025F8D2A5|nr:relaxase/mobilization nuclease domain-containing protein [uncultured Oscillibacter sp.]